MKVLLSNLLNINNKPTFSAKKNVNETPSESVVDKTPTSDVFVSSKKISKKKATLTDPLVKNIISKPPVVTAEKKLTERERLIEDYNKVVKENILGKELTSIIFANVDTTEKTP